MIANDSCHGFERNIRPRDGLMDLDRSNEERLEENADITVEKEIIAPSLEVQSTLVDSIVGEDAAKPTIHENAPNHVVCMLYDRFISFSLEFFTSYISKCLFVLHLL